MKKKFLNFLLIQFTPITLGLLFTYIVLISFNNKIISSSKKDQEIKGKQLKFRGRFANFEDSQAEVELAGSLENSNYLTIFGSSELRELPYSPYYFLPDSLQIPTIGFGHAYQQCFSVYCELLAMQKNLNKSKICIIVSPGWFETGGSNIEAFLEFVRPNFLQSIIYNQNIPKEDKLEIGRYLSDNLSLIDHPSKNILYFNNLYFSTKTIINNSIYQNSKVDLLKKVPIINEIIINKPSEKSKNTGLHYSVLQAKNKLPKPTKIDWKATRNRLQKQFVASVKENSYFIEDVYFNKFLLDSNKVYKHGFNYDVDLATNQEFKDFKLLIQLLKRYNCEASFVVQPLNPYHFTDLDGYNEVINAVVRIIKKNDYPCLNMFVTKKEDYDPALLTDVMHLGDYGWMKINEFLYKTYKPKK